MSIETLISRLDDVKETGHGKYVARCPAHEDRSPSLAITECSDGRILVHCFAGCEIEDVLDSVGLTFSDLMPERLAQKYNSSGEPVPYQPLRSPFDARQVLACISHELTVVQLIADKMSRTAEAEDEDRLSLASARIGAALLAGPAFKRPPEFRNRRRTA